MNADSPIEEREFLILLRSIEKRAILPLKWAIFAVASVFWVLSHSNNWLPPVEVFTLFVFYFMFNLGESYFFLFSRVHLSQVRPVCLCSYVVDIAFVTVLVYFDARRYASASGPASDFYLFYFLLILRGFALFRTPRMNLIANVAVGGIFLLSLWWQDTSQLGASNGLIRVVFIWLVISMSWFIVEVINRQKEEIMSGRENLVRSENMAVLGELAAGVAHEINNPLGIITAYAEFLEKNAPEGEKRLEDFQIIHKEARRCQNIVAELLDYARPTARAKTLSDLRLINDEVLDFLFRRAQGREIILRKEFAEHCPLLVLDASQIKQALLNIYLNARQAMADTGGILTVCIECDMERNRVHQRVTDTGPGMPPEALKKVFDPFFTTRSKGTGLGLSITKRIIESHDGTITISSAQGEGTTIDFYFPFDQTSV